MHPEPATVKSPFEQSIQSTHDLAIALHLQETGLARIADAAPSSYSAFQQPKRSGGFREIRAPAKPLRDVQRCVYHALGSRVRYPRWMMGGVPKRSAAMHAKAHVGRQMVATLDVEAFFPSVRPHQVSCVLQLFGITGGALDLLVRLTTLDDQLPQ